MKLSIESLLTENSKLITCNNKIKYNNSKLEKKVRELELLNDELTKENCELNLSVEKINLESDRFKREIKLNVLGLNKKYKLVEEKSKQYDSIENQNKILNNNLKISYSENLRLTNKADDVSKLLQETKSKLIETSSILRAVDVACEKLEIKNKSLQYSKTEQERIIMHQDKEIEKLSSIKYVIKKYFKFK